MNKTTHRIPIIDCTDLYHPFQDPGDNFDLVAAYGLPEIDLRGVILDITQRWRTPVGSDCKREPGFIPVTQLNYIFNRNVPAATSPFLPMISPADRMESAPRFQQGGIELVIKLLRESQEQISILVFCSCRTIAAAFNREPELFREKVKELHLNVGCSCGEIFDVDWGQGRRLPLRPGSAGYREWNVELDQHAFVTLLESGLPLALYPCATERGPFNMGPHNTFYRLDNLSFIRRMHPALASYLAYAFRRKLRHDFLAAMDQSPAEDDLAFFDTFHHKVWETAVWQVVSGRVLVRRNDDTYRLLPMAELQADDRILPSGLKPCVLEVDPSGRFTFSLNAPPSNVRIYTRDGDLQEHEKAMGEALIFLYESFSPHDAFSDANQ